LPWHHFPRVPPKDPRLCARCRRTYNPKSPNQRFCERCRPSAMLELARRRAGEYRLKYPERVKDSARRIREKYPTRYVSKKLEYSSRHLRKTRHIVLDHYSGGKRACTCCGEAEQDFLTIDHVHGGGSRERRKLFGHSQAGGHRFYRWLIRNGFPSGYSVLCTNCNLSKAKHGACVHLRPISRPPDIENQSRSEWFNRSTTNLGTLPN
jgi:hypothetical protein